MSEKQLRALDGRPLLVRHLVPEDGTALAAFNAALSNATRDLFLPHAYDEATLEKIIRRAVDGEDRAYLALDGDTVAGYFFLWEFMEPIPVLGIGIADAYQGQGLGRAFMSLLIAEARDADRDGIELTTVPKNVRAFALYKSLGFIHTGDTDNVAGDGRIVREHVMFLPLKTGAKPPKREFGPPA